MPFCADELSGRLRDLARRVDRLRPLHHDPVKYFEDRDEIRRDLEMLADEAAPQNAVKRSNPRVALAAGDVFARGRIVKVTVRGATRAAPGCSRGR